MSDTTTGRANVLAATVRVTLGEIIKALRPGSPDAPKLDEAIRHLKALAPILRVFSFEQHGSTTAGLPQDTGGLPQGYGRKAVTAAPEGGNLKGRGEVRSEALSAEASEASPASGSSDPIRKGRKPQPYDSDQYFLDFVGSFPANRRAGIPKAYRLWKQLSDEEQYRAYEAINDGMDAAKTAPSRNGVSATDFVANIVKWLEERRWEGTEANHAE